ncbi:roadblock/LC7 domain-containing protein [Frankia sp. CNm7]|uniref:Roadblock/LC7 domain-containing protein n=1 Tax=Frankia nepalensis TaxID=1836974 RepID=A0A937RBN3_9ACTN|nr:roadblock/LC7 domain-containing protein [Frankia nepalensis]MBL7495464.1 roadblock/LC7 domain-containing protein [Frankia nepalensis]MBL7510195.1 roadblock/LC7 domain-containing protein [Frankia nepalensis]MBL7521668.1 roadblock/LC7 domain-containing protein [Frankia nepalensis]MBL7626020.1 roadblock/LC7 domain-containing protein [Frankia nepalensis]
MPPTGNLDFLLNDLERRISDVRWAVALSSDGLQLARSSALTREGGDHIAAVASGFRSLALGASRYLDGGEVRQTIVEMDGGFLFVSAIGEGSCLAVAAAASADPGMIAFEMARLVTRAGQVLTPPMRAHV